MFISILRTFLIYLIIILVMRILGKRQISELQTSELVVTFLISDLAVMPIEHTDKPFWGELTPMLVLVFCELAVSFVMLKNANLRRMICGKPIVVIQDGRILEKALKRLRMTVDELFEELRQNGVISAGDVALGVIETNGVLSVVKYPEKEPLTPEQVELKPTFFGPQVVVISDGRILENSLDLCGKNKSWLEDQLRKENIALSDVFIMTADQSGKKLLVKKDTSS